MYKYFLFLPTIMASVRHGEYQGSYELSLLGLKKYKADMRVVLHEKQMLDIGIILNGDVVYNCKLAKCPKYKYEDGKLIMTGRLSAPFVKQLSDKYITVGDIAVDEKTNKITVKAEYKHSIVYTHYFSVILDFQEVTCTKNDLGELPENVDRNKLEDVTTYSPQSLKACAKDYFGTVTATCTKEGNYTVESHCKNTCTKNDLEGELPVDVDRNNLPEDVTTAAPQSLTACAGDYSGTVTATCTKEGKYTVKSHCKAADRYCLRVKTGTEPYDDGKLILSVRMAKYNVDDFTTKIVSDELPMHIYKLGETVVKCYEGEITDVFVKTEEDIITEYTRQQHSWVGTIELSFDYGAHYAYARCNDCTAPTDSNTHRIAVRTPDVLRARAEYSAAKCEGKECRIEPVWSCSSHMRSTGYRGGSNITFNLGVGQVCTCNNNLCAENQNHNTCTEASGTCSTGFFVAGYEMDTVENRNPNSCPSGSQRIATESECQEAATKIFGYPPEGYVGLYNYPFNAEGNTLYPAGCSVNWEYKNVRFNSNKTGQARSGYRVICAPSDGRRRM